jgi:Flp pilus assembly protein TadD
MQRDSILNTRTGTSLNNLVLLYQAQGKYEQAELLLQPAMAIRERKQQP